jgi:predicted HAD superfamily Cof-like phosphohydrolase
MTDGFDWVGDVAEMHEKFKLPGRERLSAVVLAMPIEMQRELLQFRVTFLKEELRELEEAKSADDFVDALVDLCVVAIGTMDAFGVDARAAWRAVHGANMAKQPGVKPGRPNPLGLPDLVKPAGWTAPSHEGNTGLIEGLV